jgi:hypothetical protein
VLLPERAHIGRINSVLRNQLPVGVRPNAVQLLQAYELAYDTLGDCCGGGVARVKDELLRLAIIIVASFTGMPIVPPGSQQGN